VVAARPISRPTSLLFLPLSTPGSTPPASQGSRSTPTGKQHSFFDEVLLLLLRPSLVAPLLPSLPCSVVEPGHLHGGGVRDRTLAPEWVHMGSRKLRRRCAKERVNSMPSLNSVPRLTALPPPSLNHGITLTVKCAKRHLQPYRTDSFRLFSSVFD
jgi:hypothetical protein